MRVNLFNLHGVRSLEGIALLLFVVGIVKVLFGILGAKAGRLPLWESISVGVGLNLKGGSDVVVAIVGTELGLMSPDLYTMYAVVAILTVLITPPVLSRLAARAQPSESEIERLDHEEARRRAYFADMERVLVSDVPELRPDLVTKLAGLVAQAKSQQREIYDITELRVVPVLDPTDEDHSQDAHNSQRLTDSQQLTDAAELDHVGLQHSTIRSDDPIQAVIEAAAAQQLVMAGSPNVDRDSSTLTLGPLLDRLVNDVPCDVLLAFHSAEVLPTPKRILVPVNGFAHSLAAADIAAYIGKACNAELVLFHVAHTRLDAMFWKESEHRGLLQAGYTVVREAQFRVARLGAWVSTRVRLGSDPAEAILKELTRQPYSMVVMGSVSRIDAGGLALGSTVEHLLRKATVPRLLLVARGTQSGV